MRKRLTAAVALMGIAMAAGTAQAAQNCGTSAKGFQGFIKEFRKEFPIADDLVVVVESGDLERNRQFVERLGKVPERLYMVQGEEASELTFSQMVRDRLGIDAKAPMWQDVYGI